MVFRVLTSGPGRRLDLQHLGNVTGKGVFRQNGRQEITPAETDEIAAWTAARAARDPDATDEITRFREEMNVFTAWLSKDASSDAVAEGAGPLLMALFDLRQTVVRRLSDED